MCFFFKLFNLTLFFKDVIFTVISSKWNEFLKKILFDYFCLNFVSRKVYKIQPIRLSYAESRTANRKPGNLKFCAPFNERIFIGRNPVDIQKEEQSVFTVDIQIKRSVLRVSNPKIYIIKKNIIVLIRFNYTLSCSLKFVQQLKQFEHLVSIFR